MWQCRTYRNQEASSGSCRTWTRPERIHVCRPRSVFSPWLLTASSHVDRLHGYTLTSGFWPKCCALGSSHSWTRPGPGSGPCLPLGADLVSQDEVGDESERKEEDGEDDEVQVEFGVQHVQLLQDGLRLLEVTRVVLVAVKVSSVQTVDGQDDTFKAIPGTQQELQL